MCPGNHGIYHRFLTLQQEEEGNKTRPDTEEQMPVISRVIFYGGLSVCARVIFSFGLKLTRKTIKCLGKKGQQDLIDR